MCRYNMIYLLANYLVNKEFCTQVKWLGQSDIHLVLFGLVIMRLGQNQ